MILVGITGSATSGKSIVSRHLAHRHGFQVSRFAEPVKRMLAVGLGLTAEQLDGRDKHEPIPEFGGLTSRHLMQTLGTEWGRRMVHSDLWVDLWRRSVAGMTGPMVVDDLRFPNEAQAIRELGGTIWRVVRPRVPIMDHPSERCMAEIAVDRTILNTSTIAALAREVDAAAADLQGGMK